MALDVLTVLIALIIVRLHCANMNKSANFVSLSEINVVKQDLFCNDLPSSTFSLKVNKTLSMV